MSNQEVTRTGYRVALPNRFTGCQRTCHGAPMYPTVAQVLELESLRRGRPRVAAGAAGLRRTVRWTHVTEHPDIAHLLRGGELLLSTGLAFPEDTADLAAFADELAALQAVRSPG